VYDFAVSPDGSRIAYSAARDDSGQRDLWLINTDGAGREQLVACDAEVCQSPSWAADGNRVAFERRALVQGAIGRSPGPARIWVVDTAARSAWPLSSDSQRLGTLPRWAPVGDRLAYYDPLESAVAVLDTASGRTVLLPSVLGDSGAWSPDARYLVYPELEAVDAGQYSQMLRADLATDVITPVTALAAANDASIAWAPSADWIAFTRQQLRSGGRGFAAIGPQVWVSHPDGSQARQVTTDTAYSYGGLRWSPDGEWVAAVRNHLETPNPKPEVWLVRADGRERRLLASDATLPAWLP
jgi:Tol biopolymer transport system component